MTRVSPIFPQDPLKDKGLKPLVSCPGWGLHPVPSFCKKLNQLDFHLHFEYNCDNPV